MKQHGAVVVSLLHQFKSCDSQIVLHDIQIYNSKLTGLHTSATL